MSTAKKTPAKRKSKKRASARKASTRKASTRKARAEASRAKSEAGKPREMVLPAGLIDDARDISNLRQLRNEKVRDLIEEVKALQDAANSESRAALVRLAKRAFDYDVPDSEVVGLSNDCTKLMLMSEGEAKQRAK